MPIKWKLPNYCYSKNNIYHFYHIVFQMIIKLKV